MLLKSRIRCGGGVLAGSIGFTRVCTEREVLGGAFREVLGGPFQKRK